MKCLISIRTQKLNPKLKPNGKMGTLSLVKNRSELFSDEKGMSANTLKLPLPDLSGIPL